MKRIIFTAFILLSTSVLSAQNDSVNRFVFPKHEVKLSFGIPDEINPGWDAYYYGTLAISYSYRHLKWLWFGINVFDYVGIKQHYHLREYNMGSDYVDYNYRTRDYGFGLVPEIRLSYLNKEKIILYSGFGVGCSLIKRHIDGLSQKIEFKGTGQITLFGWSVYFGKKQKAFWGTELGVGHKGMLSIHGGYKF